MLLSQLNQIVPCREKQIDLLNTFLSDNILENPNSILLHGPSSTGKSFLIRKFLETSNVNFSWVSCDQCSTIRILLQRAIRSIKADSGKEDTTPIGKFDVVAENFSAFYSTLSTFFNNTDYDNTQHFLVLDRIDRLPDDPSDLYSCFSRISELSGIRNLTTIFIINSLEPRSLISTSIPHIRFTSYTKQDVLTILNKMNLCKLPKILINEDPIVANKEERLFYSQFCTLVYDTLGAYTGSDIRLLKDILIRIWPVFINPLIEGKYKLNEFVRLYKENIYLFTSDVAVANRLVDIGTKDMIQMVKLKKDQVSESSLKTYELPIQSKYILCAAYLASYNPPRYDVRFFSKAKEARSKRRDTGRRKSLKINPRSLAAPAFDLERMLAILHSIIPYDDEDEDGSIRSSSNIDIGVQIATLTTLKLIIRTSSSDPLDSRTRWKVNASWSLVKQVADDVNFPIEEYLLENE